MFPLCYGKQLFPRPAPFMVGVDGVDFHATVVPIANAGPGAASHPPGGGGGGLSVARTSIVPSPSPIAPLRPRPFCPLPPVLCMLRSGLLKHTLVPSPVSSLRLSITIGPRPGPPGFAPLGV